MLSYSQHGPIRVNPTFSIEEYNRLICHLNVVPDEVFIKPDLDEIHFFTNNPIRYGL